MPWEIGLVQGGEARCGPTWVTWTPSASLVASGNVPVNMDIRQVVREDPGSFDQIVDEYSNLLPQNLWISCQNGWYVLELDWSAIHAVAQDMQDWGRATVSGVPTDSKGVGLSISLSFGPIVMSFGLIYTIGVTFFGGPGDLWSEEWTTDYELGHINGGLGIFWDRIVDYHNFATDSWTGGMGSGFVAYPGYTPPFTSFWVHRNPGPRYWNVYNWQYDHIWTANYDPDPYYSTASGIGYANGEPGPTGNILIFGNEDSDALGIPSLVNLRVMDLVTFAGYFTGTEFVTLGDLYTP